MKIKELLRPKYVKLMRDHLLFKGHPEIHFDMASYAYHTLGADSLFGEGLVHECMDPPKDICGTAACMAGVIVLLVDKDTACGWWEGRAAEILGGCALEDTDKFHQVNSVLSPLWHLTSWEQKYFLRYHRAKTAKGRASAALAMFDWLLERDVVTREEG